jgi:predicted porin
LTVAFANVSQAAQTNGPATVVGIAKTSSNILAASYAIGNTTLSAGWNDGDALANRTATAATALKSEGYRVGIAHTMGAVTLRASYADQKTDGVKETVAGLRADYALSKRSTVYMGYENWDNKNATTAVANTIAMSAFPAVNAGDRKITSVGVRHAF